MRIVRPICAGLDVHKKIVVATIATTDKQNITTYQIRTFTTLNSDLVNLRNWLTSNDCYDACMESTGKYWIPVFNVLEFEVKVVLAHPKHVKAIKGKKTDKKDSKWIADLFKHDLVPASFIPPKPIRELRDLARYRWKLVWMKSSEKNRIQNSMTVSNIAIANVIRDPFCQTATTILDYLLTSSKVEEEHCRKLIKGVLKKKSDQIIESIQGFKIDSDQAFKMKCSRAHMTELDKYIVATEYELSLRVRPFENQITLLETIPSIKRLSAMLIIAEIGVDMSMFMTAKYLSSWAGLAPTNNESAGKKKSVKIGKAGAFLKPLLVQVALNAAKESEYFKHKYERIKRRRGHKIAIIAIARMILTSIYHMFTKGEIFEPYDYSKCQEESKPKQPKYTVPSALEFLKSQGLEVTVK